MAGRGKPKVSTVNKPRPNISGIGNITRSKTITPNSSQHDKPIQQRQSIQGLSIPQRRPTGSIEVPTRGSNKVTKGIEAPTNNRSKPIQDIQPINVQRSKLQTQNIKGTPPNTPSRFFSINSPAEVARSRPQVEAISGTSPRAKVITKNVQSPSRNSVGNHNQYDIESPEVERPSVNDIRGTQPTYSIGKVPRTSNGPLRVSDL